MGKDSDSTSDDADAEPFDESTGVRTTDRPVTRRATLGLLGLGGLKLFSARSAFTRGRGPIPLAWDVDANGHRIFDLAALDLTAPARIGTGDETPLVLVVGGERALFIKPTPTEFGPNIVGGHRGNKVDPRIHGATIAGGGGTVFYNPGGDSDDIPELVPNEVTGIYGTVGGGAGNSSSGAFATVGGGRQNRASDVNDTVSGGHFNTASGGEATVSGGWGNHADGTWATVGGGFSNSASGESVTIGGGFWNSVTGGGTTLGGGLENRVRGNSVTVAGGQNIRTRGSWTTVGGGFQNVTSGHLGTIPGGAHNEVTGHGCFAAGVGARAVHRGAFVWASASTDGGEFDYIPFTSNGRNTWSARCTGGARFVTAIDGAGAPTAGVRLPSGSGSWSSLSDRDVKENVTPVDANDVLDRVTSLPISRWSYTAEEGTVRHMGPVAQDFHEAFGLGRDDTHIASVDADGVTLAAIQGLAADLDVKEDRISELEQEIVDVERDRRETDRRIAALERENETLRERDARLEERIERIEAAVGA